MKYISDFETPGATIENDIVSFKLHLQGRALEDHSIDAKELGKALIGLEETLGLITNRLAGTKQKFQPRVGEFGLCRSLHFSTISTSLENKPPAFTLQRPDKNKGRFSLKSAEIFTTPNTTLHCCKSYVLRRIPPDHFRAIEFSEGRVHGLLSL